MLIEVFAGPKGQRTDTNGYRVKIARPTWENIVEHWKQYRPIVPGNTKEQNSTARVSSALIKANKIKEFQGKEHAEKLHEWLKNEANWGTKFETIDVSNVEDKLKKVRETIKGGCGIYIVLSGKRDNDLAALWMGDDVVGGYNGINNGKTVYFWELKSEEYLKLQGIKESSMNRAAIEGFKIINKISTDLKVEVIATIYETDNIYRLNGINIGNKDKVTPTDKENFYDASGNKINKRNIKANIHTHVGTRTGEDFFSGRDFLMSYSDERPIYLKHIDSDRIVMAEPPVDNIKINSRLDVIVDREGESLSEKGGIDSCSFDETNPVSRELCQINVCSNDMCISNNCQVKECERICDSMLRHVVQKYNMNRVIALKYLKEKEWTISRCLLGIFRNHGQKVWDINPSTGNGRVLW